MPLIDEAVDGADDPVAIGFRERAEIVHLEIAQALRREPAEQGRVEIVRGGLQLIEGGVDHLAHRIEEARVLGRGDHHAGGEFLHLAAAADIEQGLGDDPCLQVRPRPGGFPQRLLLGRNLVDHALDHRLQQRILGGKVIKKPALAEPGLARQRLRASAVRRRFRPQALPPHRGSSLGNSCGLGHWETASTSLDLVRRRTCN